MPQPAPYPETEMATKKAKAPTRKPSKPITARKPAVKGKGKQTPTRKGTQATATKTKGKKCPPKPTKTKKKASARNTGTATARDVPTAKSSSNGSSPSVHSGPSATKKKSLARWFVLCVESGMDSQVRKSIQREKKIHNLESKIGKCYSPVLMSTVTIKSPGEILAEGTDERDLNSARLAGYRWLREYLGIPNGEPCVSNADTPGYRVVCFPSKGKEKGKLGNTWDWKVRKNPPEGSEKEVPRLTLKFPGYLICRLKWCADAFYLIKKVRGVLWFLDSDENPTPLEDVEACELLIEKTETGRKLAAYKRELKELPKIGDKVRVTDGAFAGLDGTMYGTQGPGSLLVHVFIMGQKVLLVLKPTECRKL